MRVCHIWQSFYPSPVGGLERYIMNLSDFLSQNNSDMSFILLTDKSDIPFLRARKIQRYQEFNSLRVCGLGPNCTTIFRNVLLQSLHFKSNLFNQLALRSLYQEAVKWQETRNVDAFHLHGIWAIQYPLLGLLLSQKLHKPLIVSLHGDSVGTQRFFMPIETPEILHVLNHASAITTYSQKVLDTLNRLGLANKSYLVPNFVDTKLFDRPTENTDSFRARVTMVTRLDPFKDPVTPIRAFELVRKEIPEATLQIIGDGALYAHLSNLIHELHLEDAVVLNGKQIDVRKHLWNSDIFLATTSGYIALLEAWAAGLAVIAPSLGITKEVITNNHNGLLVPPHDAGQLAYAIINLLRDRELRDKLALNGLLTVKKYDIENIVPKIAKIYDSIVKK